MICYEVIRSDLAHKWVICNLFFLLCLAMLAQIGSAEETGAQYRCAHRTKGSPLVNPYWDVSQKAYSENEYFELKSDGTFFFQDYGLHIGGYGGVESFYGKYDVNGNVLTLKFEFFGMARRGTIEGSTIKMRMEDCDIYRSGGAPGTSVDRHASVAASTTPTPRPTSEPLTNEDIRNMVKAKLGEGVIIAKIKSCKCRLDTSASALIKLKHAGTSDAVLQAVAETGESGSARGEPAAGQPTAEVPGVSTSHVPNGPEIPHSVPPESQTPPAPKPSEFSVQHRHITFLGPGPQARSSCSGRLSVSQDGTVRYDCDQTQDPSGRCDHVSFSPGSLKKAKIGLDGSLHLASKRQGNFDFYGDRNNIKQAYELITAGTRALAGREASTRSANSALPRAVTTPQAVHRLLLNSEQISAINSFLQGHPGYQMASCSTLGLTDAACRGLNKEWEAIARRANAQIQSPFAVWADLNGDGSPDLVVAMFSSNAVNSYGWRDWMLVVIEGTRDRVSKPKVVARDQWGLCFDGMLFNPSRRQVEYWCNTGGGSFRWNGTKYVAKRMIGD